MPSAPAENSRLPLAIPIAGVDDRALVIGDPASRREWLRLTGPKETVTAIIVERDALRDGG
jgi:hypothetical protein